MNRIVILYMLFLVLAFTLACTERMDIELDSSYTRLVVYGEITDIAGRNYVKLSKTSNYFSNNESPPVSNAIIEISDGNENFRLSENIEKKGLYELPADFKGIPGKTYNLFISDIDIDENGEKENYTASSRLHAVNPIDSITLKYTKNSFFSGWEVQLWAWDPKGIDNYYSFRIYKNDEIITDSLREHVVINDVLFDGGFTYGITAMFLNDSDPEEKAQPGDLISFEMNGITEEYYNFIIEAQSETGPRTPLFSGPPANISTNLSNDALGFFTAYSVTQDSIIVPEYPDELTD